MSVLVFGEDRARWAGRASGNIALGDGCGDWCVSIDATATIIDRKWPGERRAESKKPGQLALTGLQMLGGA